MIEKYKRLIDLMDLLPVIEKNELHYQYRIQLAASLKILEFEAEPNKIQLSKDANDYFSMNENF